MEQVHGAEEAEKREDRLQRDRAAIVYARNAGMSNRITRESRVPGKSAPRVVQS
jgi:hypothetical protein